MRSVPVVDGKSSTVARDAEMQSGTQSVPVIPHQRVLFSSRFPWGSRCARVSFRPDTACDTVIMEAKPMPVSARAKETPIEDLPLEERIRRRAYELYVERGNQSGSEADDWLQAEEEALHAQEQR